MSRTPRSTQPSERDQVVDGLLCRVAASSHRDEQRRLRAQVVEEMLPLADGLAHRYSGRGIERDDLEQVARTALVAAVDRYMECEPADVESARMCGSGFRPASLDAPVLAGGTEGDRLADVGDFYHRFELHTDLRLALDSLGERDRRVVRLRFVEELTQSEIGSMLGVSQMQVSRILSRILRQLRGSLDVVAA
ncbi:sigma-70 family RNA polymerase sigma factor [Phycicoccus jejuensis]|uniref:sigma-70 family RNA polymerase sigma factor n=1 Tax=Phycicoccus jejuensis TaxID=367299 RepID=UPI00068E13C8|nr:sigma-70 family RNA polymerase sigma factor [Phycicoccus jejuensis]